MTAVTVVHFLPFWSNTINLSSLRAGELQWAIHDKAASSWVNLSSSVMLTMETEASALQYSGKVTHSRVVLWQRYTLTSYTLTQAEVCYEWSFQ